MTQVMPAHDAPVDQPATPIDVVIVNDDPLFRRYLAHVLRLAGFAVRLASDGLGLRAAIAAAVPGVVVIDVLLRHESGLDLCRELRSTPAVADIAIIMTGAETTSAVSSRVDEVSALAAGASAFITKGRSIEPLVDVISDALGSLSR